MERELCRPEPVLDMTSPHMQKVRFPLHMKRRKEEDLTCNLKYNANQSPPVLFPANGLFALL